MTTFTSFGTGKLFTIWMNDTNEIFCIIITGIANY
jgi:hypothetical protein